MVQLPIPYLVLILAATLVVAGICAYLLLLLTERFRLATLQRKLDEKSAQADQENDNRRKQMLLDAREQALREREKLLEEVDAARSEVRKQEREVEKRADQLQRQAEMMVRKEKTLETAQRKAADTSDQYQKRSQALDRVLDDQKQVLERITGLAPEQAKKMLLDRLESQYAEEVGERLQRWERDFEARVADEARKKLLIAIQRYASGHTAETTVSSIDIPNDEMKGRIIGREGRNIRAFEKSTGVDVIVDDTPGIVVVSAFDNVRREIAKVAMLRLIADGRIHPARIEEVVIQVREEINRHIMEVGRNACLEADVAAIDPRMVEMLGRLKFRTSYSQNVLQHSLEVAALCGMLASELGMDAALARRCGLLHDIGKAADHEMEGGHPQIGGELARRCKENEIVIHAIEGHHDQIHIDNPYTVLVASADAISASRPGARRETLEKYVKRLEELESLACEFRGVQSAYAIQAGREIRVIADAAQTTDKTAAKVCRDIARAIEQRLSYPGEIKVTVLRETRAVEVAK